MLIESVSKNFSRGKLTSRFLNLVANKGPQYFAFISTLLLQPFCPKPILAHSLIFNFMSNSFSNFYFIFSLFFLIILFIYIVIYFPSISSKINIACSIFVNTVRHSFKNREWKWIHTNIVNNPKGYQYFFIISTALLVRLALYGSAVYSDIKYLLVILGLWVVALFYQEIYNFIRKKYLIYKMDKMLFITKVLQNIVHILFIKFLLLSFVYCFILIGIDVNVYKTVIVNIVTDSIILQKIFSVFLPSPCLLMGPDWKELPKGLLPNPNYLSLTPPVYQTPELYPHYPLDERIFTVPHMSAMFDFLKNKLNWTDPMEVAKAFDWCTAHLALINNVFIGNIDYLQGQKMKYVFWHDSERTVLLPVHKALFYSASLPHLGAAVSAFMPIREADGGWKGTPDTFKSIMSLRYHVMIRDWEPTAEYIYFWNQIRNLYFLFKNTGYHQMISENRLLFVENGIYDPMVKSQENLRFSLQDLQGKIHHLHTRRSAKCEPWSYSTEWYLLGRPEDIGVIKKEGDRIEECRLNEIKDYKTKFRGVEGPRIELFQYMQIGLQQDWKSRDLRSSVRNRFTKSYNSGNVGLHAPSLTEGSGS